MPVLSVPRHTGFHRGRDWVSDSLLCHLCILHLVYISILLWATVSNLRMAHRDYEGGDRFPDYWSPYDYRSSVHQPPLTSPRERMCSYRSSPGPSYAYHDSVLDVLHQHNIPGTNPHYYNVPVPPHPKKDTVPVSFYFNFVAIT